MPGFEDDLHVGHGAAGRAGSGCLWQEVGFQISHDKPDVAKAKHWERVIPFFDYPDDIRKAVYTTNAIESLNRSLRKVIKTKGAFPNDAAIMKIFYLALTNIAKKWTMPIRPWKGALSQFAIKFAGRFEL